METQKKKSVHHIMRILHRYIGFFVVGIALVYSLSGIVLIYRDTNFLKQEELITKNLESNLKGEELGQALGERRIRIVNEDENSIQFDMNRQIGTYTKATGVAEYKKVELPFFINQLTRLHKSSSRDLHSVFTTIWGALLFFLTISSFWMFKPKTQFFKRGLYFTGAGIVFVVAMLMFM